MSNRQPISRKMRFEVLHRDGFKCRYCGKAAPNAVLHIDHVHPVSRGGNNALDNLVAACAECNLGKGAMTLLATKTEADAPSWRERAMNAIMTCHRRDTKLYAREFVFLAHLIHVADEEGAVDGLTLRWVSCVTGLSIREIEQCTHALEEEGFCSQTPLEPDDEPGVFGFILDLNALEGGGDVH